MLNPISLATEGLDDEAAAKKICSVLNIPVSASYPAGGKTRLDPKIPSYNRAAAIAPWLVLRDLDADAPCPSQLAEQLIAEKAPALLLRIPVKSIESWLLADPISLSTFLGISQSLIPLNPEMLPNPKLTMVNLARRSRNRGVQAMVPQQGFSVQVGPEYTSRLIDYSRQHWDPLRAATTSNSLSRCIKALCQLYGL
jgi:hypothetical protein